MKLIKIFNIPFVFKKVSNLFLRKIINFFNRKRLKNQGMSVLSSNCNGALILHDLGQKFNSPFVNLWITPPHFIKFMLNIDYYLQCKLIFKQEVPYPLGYLDDLEIHFIHYTTADEVLQKWQQRCKRIDKENLFIMMTDRDGCGYQDLVNFDKLPYKNKVVFTHKYYPEIKSSYYIKGFENDDFVGVLSDYKSFTGRKYYDDFDYVKWFNSNVKNE